MIKSLVLKNFQKHKVLKIRFAPGITSIIGRTDAGKSSIIRSLRWVCRNVSPRDFIRKGAKEAVVVLKVLNGSGTPTSIVRRKGRSNVYKLDGKVFRSFGSKPPDRIVEVLSLSDINFQKQHDQSFWLSESAPEVSRQLNRVIDLSVIDSSLSKSSALVRQARERVKVSVDRLQNRRVELRELRESAVARIESFSALKESYEKLRVAAINRSSLDGILQAISACNLPARKKREEDSRLLLEAATRLKKAEYEWHSLDQLTEELTWAIQRSTPPPPFTPVEQVWEELKRKKAQRDRLSDLVGEVFRATLDMNAKVEWAEVLGKKLPERCPTCGKISG